MLDKLFLTLQMLRADFSALIDRDEEGATMVEYGLMVVSIAVVVAGAALLLGGRIQVMFDGLL